jgi:hypothetical protein
MIAGRFSNEKQLGFHLTLSKERIAKKRLIGPPVGRSWNKRENGVQPPHNVNRPGCRPAPGLCVAMQARLGTGAICSELLTWFGKLWLPESCPDRTCIPAINAAAAI